MKATSLLVLILLACDRSEAAPAPAAGPAAPQNPPPAADAKWKATFKLLLMEKDGKWVFIVDGITNIPPETKLRARIYALEDVPDFKAGEREDDEPLVWEDTDSNPSYRGFNPLGGKIHEEVYSFTRRPYSLRYRAKVHYVARDQTDAVMLKVGDDDFFRHADLRVGTDADFAKELETRVKEVAADLVAVEKLYAEIADRYAETEKGFKADAWKKWKEPWLEKIEVLKKRNEERYNLWLVWMERQAKMRVGGMCELLTRTSTAIEERFLEEAKNEKRIQELLKGFHDYFEEAIEVIGIDAPLDPRTVTPIMAAYEKGLVPLREWIRSGKGAPGDVFRIARREGLTALFQLVPLLQNRKRGYLYVNNVSTRFTRLFELNDAQAPLPELQKALEEHDAALAEFKKFAGLK